MLKFSDGVSRQTPKSLLQIGTALAYGLAITIFLLIAQSVIDNVHITTTNGLWKSIDIRRWIESPSWSLMQPSNAIFYPVYATLAKLLTEVGVYPDLVWRQMAVINAIFAGVAGAVAFAFVAAWTRNLFVTLLAVTAYMMSGYILLHGLINEDIMPGYSIVLTSTLLACAWFGRPSAPRIMVVGVLFAVGWLFEWRLMFPSLPPLLLALFLAPGTRSQRILRPFLFLAAMAVPPAIVAMLTLTVNTAEQAITLFTTLFWTGKGVGSGWGGFSLNKVWFEWAGVAEALIGGRYIWDPAWLMTTQATEILVATALLLVLGWLCLQYAWRNRSNPTVCAAFVIVGGNAGCGIVFNLYSQPQDPQMQINVTIWLLFGWVLLIDRLIRMSKLGSSIILQRFALALAVASPIVLGSYNFAVAYAVKGYDTRTMNRIAAINAQFDPSKTVFVYHDFDGTITWQSSLYGMASYVGIETLPPAPAQEPLFKWIGFVRDAVQHPEWTAEQHATKVTADIDRALELGYRLVTPAYWTGSEDEWVQGFATVVADSNKSREIWRLLHQNFTATKIWSEPEGESWYEITRRACMSQNRSDCS
ncbi:hypothetical protein DXT96_00020 [Agrobacterium sp. ICMP 6402]|nr:hypothetical protein [Agrobacterium sp. ICMP 6402]